MGWLNCYKSPRLRFPSWSWKGRGERTWLIFPSPPSMSWPTTIRVAIGAWTIPTENAGSGTIITRMYGPVRSVGGSVATRMSCRPSRKSMPNAYRGKNGVIGYWIIYYAIIVLRPKTRRLPKAEGWNGSRIIATNVAVSYGFLNNR